MKKPKTKGLNAFDIHMSTYNLYYIFIIFPLVAIAMIGQAERSQGFQKDLCLSLGTGLLASFLVSLMFVFAEKTASKIKAMKQRESFLFDFKALLHSMITYLDFDKTIESPVDYAAFIKIQHRWFHEYYKKTVANNSSLKETNIRKKQILDFYKTQSAWMKQYFEFDNRWKNSYLNQSEKDLLNRLYLSYKKTEIALEQKAFNQSFYEFAFFLEWLSELPDTFREFKNYKLVTVSSEENNLNFDFSKFYEKEKFLAGINSFHETRKKIYLSEYYKKDEK